MLNSDNSFYSYMDGTLSWLDASRFHYKYSNNNNGDYRILVIQFDMGKRLVVVF